MATQSTIPDFEKIDVAPSESPPKAPALPAQPLNAGAATASIPQTSQNEPPATVSPASAASAPPVSPTSRRWMGDPPDPAPATAPNNSRKWLAPAAVTLKHWMRQTPSWLASMVFHMTVLLIMASITVHAMNADQTAVVMTTPTEVLPLQDMHDPGPLNLDAPKLDDNPTALNVLDSPPSPSLSLEVGGPPSAVPLNPFANDPNAGPLHVDLSPFGDRSAPPADLLKTAGVPGGTATGLGGRYGQAKADLIKRAGGTPQSEAAVAEALKWLSIHQMPDGGWDFDLNEVPSCKGKCDNSGILREVRIAATALALLPFLGAGETQKDGKYAGTVQSGLYYLISRAKRLDGGISFYEPNGTMYSHGLATIVLCEDYAMTGDKAVLPFAQGAIDFINYAQDPDGGGWRYEEKSPGDTSVTGWQLMALKSAQLAKLQTRSNVTPLINKFLDSVQDDGGATYGYRTPSTFRPGTTSVGLLCRMYLGWKKDNPALKQGVRNLSIKGPSINNDPDMYYNYYATQLMRHWGGEEWERWNYKIREWLIAQQSKKGHEKGSWFMNDNTAAPKAVAGGWLYCTSMATMILEVYYRTLPLYSESAVSDEFGF